MSGISVRVKRSSLTRLAVGMDREVDGDSIRIGWIGDVTVEFVCVGVSITDGFINTPLPDDEISLFE